MNIGELDLAKNRQKPGPKKSARIGPDRGTPEMQARRQAGLCGDPVDVLWHYELIDDGQREAGLKFLRLYVTGSGKAMDPAKNHLWDAAGGSQGWDVASSRPEERRRYLEAVERLKADHGAMGVSEVMGVVVYRRLPDWFLRHGVTMVVRSSDARRKAALLDGLQSLARHFRCDTEKAA